MDPPAVGKEDQFRSRCSIKQIFPNSLTLKVYLSLISGNSFHPTSTSPRNSIEIDQYLTQVYVLPEAMRDDILQINHASSHSSSIGRASLNDVVNRLIAQLIRIHNTNSENYRELNCLALGYRSKSATCESELRSFFDIECYYVNTLHSFIYMTPWLYLAECYGELILRHLLTRPIFIRSANGCFLQVCGTPVPAIIHKFPDQSNCRIFDGISNYGSVLIPRFMVFYMNGNCQRIWRLLTKEFKSLASLANDELIISEERDKKTDHVSDRLFGLSQLYKDDVAKDAAYDSLQSTTHNIINAFNATDIREILHHHCPSKDVVGTVLRKRSIDESMATSPTANSVKSDEPEVVIPGFSTLTDIVSSHRKKTRRGCRAGAIAKHRKVYREGDGCIIATPGSDMMGGTGITRYLEPVVTVGQYLVKELVQSVNVAVKLFDAKDIVSQDPRNLTSSTLLPSTGELQSPYAQLSGRSVGSSVEPMISSSQTLDRTLCSDNNISVSNIATDVVLASGHCQPSTDAVVSVAWRPDPLLSLSSNDIDISPPGTAFHLHRRFDTRIDTSTTDNASSAPRTRCKRKASKLVAASNINQPPQLAHALEPPSLFDLSSSHDEVAEFVKSCCRYCFTIPTVWGTRRNMNKFMGVVDRYIRLGKGETMSVAQLTFGIKAKSLAWIPSLSNFSSDEINYMAARLMHWIFTSFINPLLSTYFYITEGEGLGLTMLYYRKPVWRRISNFGCEQVNKSFVKVVSAKISGSSSSNVASGVHNDYVYRGRGLPISQWLQFPNPSLNVDDNQPKDNQPEREINLTTIADEAILDAPTLKRTRLSISSVATEPLDYPSNPMPVIGMAIPAEITRAASTSSSSTSTNNMIPTVRFVPKKSSVRAITNMRIKRRSNINTSSNETAITGRTISAQSFVTNAPEAPTFSASLPSMNPIITQSALYSSLHIFRQVYNTHPHLIGFGVLGLDEIYMKLKAYRSKLLSLPIPDSYVDDDDDKENSMNSMNSQPDSSFNSNHIDSFLIERSKQGPSGHKFYIAVLDLEKCYDNVDTQNLYDIMKNIIKNYSINPNAKSHKKTSRESQSMPAAQSTESANPDYTVHKYSVTHYMASTERIVTKNLRYVTQSDDIITFKDAAKAISENYRKSIITDGVVHSKLSESEVMNILRQHLFSHVIKLPSVTRNSTSLSRDGSYYTQVKGIPQGSILSPILCNYYYGHAENEVFGSDSQVQILGLKDGKSVIIRLMDDYIVISVDSDCVKAFLQRAHNALQPYGGGVNPVKTKVNFDVDIMYRGERVTLNKIPDSSPMPWCGLHIDTTSLEVSPSYTRLFDRPISASFALSAIQSGVALRRLMKGFVRMKCHALVLDMNINSYDRILKTVYRLFIVAALRTISVLSKMPGGSLIARNIPYLIRCIDDAIAFGSRLIHSRTKYKVCRRLCIGSHNRPRQYATPNHLSSFERAVSQVYYISEKNSHQFGVCALPVRQALWVGYEAFIKALATRKSQYQAIIQRLVKRQQSMKHSDAAKVVEHRRILVGADVDIFAMYATSQTHE